MNPRILALVALLMVCGSLALYSQTSGFGYVAFDDESYVADNPHLRPPINAAAVRWAFTTGYMANWHPFTWLSYMLDAALFGSKPGLAHLVNAFLHGLNAAILFLALVSLTGRHIPALFAALLLLVHPLHVESVAWIAERKDVLFGLFWWLAAWAYAGYARKKSIWRYALVILAFAASLMSKPMAVTLPCALLLLDYWPLNRCSSPRDALRLVLEKIPLFALSAGASAITFLAQRAEEAVMSADRIPWSARALNAIVSYGAYLCDMIWPSGLAAFYPHPGPHMAWGPVLLSAFALTMLMLLCLRTRRTHPWNLMGLLWYLGTLTPVIGIVQVGLQARADRYAYLPLVGAYIALAWTADSCCTTKTRTRVCLALGCAAVCALAVTTWVQTGYWRDGETLFRRALAVTERNGMAHYNLGVILSRKGSHAEAEQQFRETIKFEPERKAAYNNLGGSLAAQGKNEEAALAFMDAIQHERDNPEIYYNLAATLMKLGRVTEAKGRLAETLRLKPGHAEAMYLYGNALFAERNLNGAIDWYRKAIKADPEMKLADARINLGAALMQAGDPDGAAKAFEAVVRHDPSHAAAWSNLGHAHAGAGDFRGALEAFRKALEHNPADGSARENVRLLEQELGINRR